MGTTSTMPKGEPPSPPYNLTLMLLMLKRHGVNDSMLCRKYGLNKHSLSKIKKGERLTYALSDYFEKLLNALESVLDQYEIEKDVDCYREVKDFEHEVLRMEHGWFKVSAIMFVKMLMKNS